LSRRVLVSVSDKEGLEDFVKGLLRLDYEIVSTGGTARFLRESGARVTEVSEVTGFPEILGGRVKTLHPKIHGGLLGIREDQEHRRQMREQAIHPIDMLVVNLYPFQQTVARPGVTLEEAIEQIDIGGPAIGGAAAKTFRDVAVVVRKEDYGWILQELEAQGGALTLESRFRLAQQAFSLTARYDTAISSHLSRMEASDGAIQPGPGTFPSRLGIDLEKVMDLRYGENPHQRAAFYRELAGGANLLPDSVQLQGKELSFNNLLDLNAAYQLSAEFELACAVIIKHNNPCGVAVSRVGQANAYLKARQCDPVSAFGSVLGFNRTIDAETAQAIASTFVEAVIAPGYQPEALERLSARKNLRLLRHGAEGNSASRWDYKRVEGGLLVQEVDRASEDEDGWKVATDRSPAPEEWEALRFAWIVGKHIKSNAIVYTSSDRTVGIGVGQMSRVDSARLAISKALSPLEGCVMASDAFFPFRDGIDIAAEAGIRAVIQPGGSVRDSEVIQAANESRMAMVLTGRRHFRH